MNHRARPFDDRIDEYWEWFSVALFLLVTVDLLTTIGAMLEYGPAAEANPLMAWLLGQDPVVVVVVNLWVVVVAVVAFSGILETVRRSPAPYGTYMEYALELWLGGLVAMGLLVFANNLAVIVIGQSLI